MSRKMRASSTTTARHSTAMANHCMVRVAVFSGAGSLMRRFWYVASRRRPALLSGAFLRLMLHSLCRYGSAGWEYDCRSLRNWQTVATLCPIVPNAEGESKNRQVHEASASGIIRESRYVAVLVREARRQRGAPIVTGRTRPSGKRGEASLTRSQEGASDRA
jgi:hypothetical protein